MPIESAKQAAGDGVDLFRMAGAHLIHHVVVGEAAETTLCGSLDVPKNLEGTVHGRRVFPFNGFGQKPREKWCDHCWRTCRHRNLLQKHGYEWPEADA